MFRSAVVVAFALGSAACSPPPATARDAPASGAVVDSVVPIPEALARFREDLRERPKALRGGASSAEGLMRRLDSLLVKRDAAGLETLALDRSEFAYLYYESTPLSRPPYELPPALMWFQMRQESRIGATRLLREMGGRGLGDATLVCPDPPIVQGKNRVWSGCVARLGSDVEVRLVWALIERDGRWKVLSYANDY